MNKNKGITLIALIVTIIVMLILAGVSINLILGDNGTIKRSENTKIENLRAQVLDLIQNETKTAVDEFGDYNQSLAISNIIENYDNTKVTEIVIEANRRLGITFKEQGNDFKFVVSNKGEVTAVSEYVCEKPNVNFTISDEINGRIKSEEVEQPDGTKKTAYAYELLAPVPLGFVASDYNGTKEGNIQKVTSIAMTDKKDVNGNYIVETRYDQLYYDGEDKIEYGLVIYEGDKEVNSSNLDEAKTTRNQFVWIPVKEEELYSLLVMDENGKFYYTRPVDYDLDNSIGVKTALAVEPYFKYTSKKAEYEEKKITTLFGITGNRIEESFSGLLRLNYDNMLNSIKQWGGFYIARYEISSEEGGKNKKIVKGRTTEYSETTWFDSLYNLNNFNINNDVYSNMLTGLQLELVNNFIDGKVMPTADNSYKEFSIDIWTEDYKEDFYKEKVNGRITGQTEYTKVSNIYDLIRKSISKFTKCCFG